MPRLLLIDDSLTDSARFTEMLAGDHQVEHRQTLRDGITRSTQEPFDAVLLELDLPDSQGIATYLAAREHLPATPIVVLTTASDDQTVAFAYLRGAQDFLYKSQMTPEWLAHSIKHALLRGRALELEDTLTTPGSEEGPLSQAGSIWSQERVNEIIVLRLLPKRLMDAGNILLIEERLATLVESGNRHLVVSLENVEYISNAALGVLIGVQKKMRTRNGSLHLADLEKGVRNQLGSRQFHRHFRIYDDVASAVASITPAP